jgi:hypothetical protein
MAPFFFSYAHNDALDDHLDDFFDEVNKRVRFLTGTKADGFRDSKKLRAGEDWSRELAAELAVTPALVCLYSPSYFQSRVCARELQIFLERRRKYMEENPGKRPSNVIPVLWQPCEVPFALPGFEYEKPRTRELEKDGVWEVRDRKKMQEFNAIAKSVAVRVKETQKAPLPPFTPVPVLGGVQSAFEPPPLPPDEFDAADVAGPHCATFIYPTTPQWKQWPFVPSHDPLLYISAAVAKGRDLISRQLTFDPATGPLPRLNAAREKNNLLVLLLSGSHLTDPALVARLREFDTEGFDVVSTLVVWPPGSKTSAAQDVVGQAFPKLSQRTPPFFYPDLDQPETFALAVGESLDHLKMAVLKNPRALHELPFSSEFAALPSVVGPGSRKAA